MLAILSSPAVISDTYITSSSQGAGGSAMAIVLGSFLIDRGAMLALAGQKLHCISQHKMPRVTQLTVH